MGVLCTKTGMRNLRVHYLGLLLHPLLPPRSLTTRHSFRWLLHPLVVIFIVDGQPSLRGRAGVGGRDYLHQRYRMQPHLHGKRIFLEFNQGGLHIPTSPPARQPGSAFAYGLIRTGQISEQ